MLQTSIRWALIAIVPSPFYLSLHSSGQEGYDDDTVPVCEPDSVRGTR